LSFQFQTKLLNLDSDASSFFIKFTHFYKPIFFSRHLPRRNRQGIKHGVDFVNTGSTNLTTHAGPLIQGS